MASLKAIFFDLDDTLIFAHAQPRQAWAAVLADHKEHFPGHDLERVLHAIVGAARWFWSDPTRHREGRLDIGRARGGIMDRAFRELGLDDEGLKDRLSTRFDAHRKQAMYLFPDVHETLEHLAGLGLKLALVTNGAAAAQREKIERFDLAGRFDHILIEGEFGAGKPEPQVYRHLLERLGVQPRETWMVGDHLEWEVAAPQRLGIKGIWCNVQGTALPAGSDVQPDHVVGGVRELLALI